MMQRLRHYAVALVLGAAMVGPIAMKATPQPAEVQVRVYDRVHHDYHNWDDHEAAAWKVYLSNNHIAYHEYAKGDRAEQDRYWTWRHEHPDHR
jgi:hypothetical protein